MFVAAAVVHDVTAYPQVWDGLCLLASLTFAGSQFRSRAAGFR